MLYSRPLLPRCLIRFLLLTEYQVHQHDKDADLSLYFAPRILGDLSPATPQFHFGALPGELALFLLADQLVS